MKVVYQGGTGEITEKKSRFIATVQPVETEEEAVSFINEMKKKYWDARHNCSAFVLGERQEMTRCSDDGEPAQTAGRPILDVMLGEDIHNAVIVVTRYFGGTLLGTGGLVRAYQQAAKEGLKNSTVIDRLPGCVLTIGMDYTTLGKVQYILAQQEITVTGSDYTDSVSMTVMVPQEKRQKLEAELVEGPNGNVQLTWGETVEFARIEEKIKIFQKSVDISI